jgi:hypothetical protein
MKFTIYASVLSSIYTSFIHHVLHLQIKIQNGYNNDVLCIISERGIRELPAKQTASKRQEETVQCEGQEWLYNVQVSSSDSKLPMHFTNIGLVAGKEE